MSSLPLFNSVAQALNPNALNRSEAYRVAGVNAADENALSQATLAGLGLPGFGESHPSNPNIVATNITIRQLAPNLAEIAYTFGPTSQASSSQDVTQLSVSDVSFDVRPIQASRDVPAIFVSPMSTETAELDGQGDPTGNTIGVHRPGFTKEPKVLEFTQAEIVYTVADTAENLGITNSVGSVGVAPAVVAQANDIHTIGSIALLFNGVNLRWTRSESGSRIYSLEYTWTYERGLTSTAANLPDGWTTDPEFGPAGNEQPIIDSRGIATADPNGDFMYGAALPHVPAPPSIQSLGHIGGAETRYIIPPYCRVDVLDDSGGDFAIPYYQAVPLFDGVDTQQVWQQFPGVS